VVISDQILLAGTVLAFVAAIITILQKPTFISASHARQMQDTITQMRADLEECKADCKSRDGRIAFLESHVTMLMSDREFWQNEYRKLKERGD